MVTCDRESVLAGIARLGGGICGYSIGPELWVSTRCDCKFGVEHPASMMRESNGCPELRSLYSLVSAMTDAEWCELCDRAGMVDTRALFGPKDHA